ncbi:putative inactive dehydrogenase EasA [Hypsizygus marmoreus]|uniref:Inactive dehydrogenase EasA n=1 Tax=Hypsizygus marmoreus TaxID=39966 RepID=A0A369JLG7_HYPMA|nr:putative inactive dehydrogenase EasA [Hypsizygus marmoreus]
MTRIHENGSFIFLQLWAHGQAAQPDVLTSEDPPLSIVAPSPIPFSSQPTPDPRELTIAEIHEYMRLYAQAAKNAIHGAGFDGIEVHGMNRYLVDWFLQDVSNQRSDEYGGSIEGRSRFPLEVVDAVVDAVGPERTLSDIIIDGISESRKYYECALFLQGGRRDACVQFERT